MKNAASVLSVKFNSTDSYEQLVNICQEDLGILKTCLALENFDMAIVMNELVTA